MGRMAVYPNPSAIENLGLLRALDRLYMHFDWLVRLLLYLVPELRGQIPVITVFRVESWRPIFQIKLVAIMIIGVFN